MISEKAIRKIMYGTTAAGLLIAVGSSLFSNAAIEQIVLIIGLLVSSGGIIFGLFY